MKKHVKWIGLGAAALLLIVAGAYTMLAPESVALTQVIPQEAQMTLTVQGSAEGDRVMELYPLTSGPLLEVFVEEGQQVRAGEVICTIDPSAIQQQIRQAESGLRSSRAQQQNWQQQTHSQQVSQTEQITLQSLRVEQGQRDLEKAQDVFSQQESLYDMGAVSKVELEEAQEAVRGMELALESSQAELAILRADPNGTAMAGHYQAMIDLEQAKLVLLEQDLAHTTVTAPADGVISSLPIEGSNYVWSSSPVAELTVTQNLRVEAGVTTNDVDSIALGDEALLRLKRRQGDVEFPGTVTKIAENAALSISSLGLEEYQVKVEIKPGEAPKGVTFGAGFDVEVQFYLYRKADQLLVPKSALFQQDGVDMLWVVKGGKLRAVPVTKGMELRTQFVIEEGIEAESYVVTDANDKTLKEGLRVTAAKS